MFRDIDNDAFADRLASLRSTTAPHRDRALLPDTAPNDLYQGFLRARNQNALRADFINARVSGIKRPIYRIETNLGIDPLEERCIYSHHLGE